MDFTKEQAVTNLLAVWERTTEDQYNQGKLWYLNAHDFALNLSTSYSDNYISTIQVCGIIAALSPRNKWADNKRDTENVLKDLVSGQELTNTVLSSPYPKIENVIRILDGVHPTKTLGQKARSFFNCILNPLCDDVCIDSWAARAAGYNEKWISKEDYPVLQDYYREAAKSVGLGHTPALFQAIIWVTYRGSAD